MSNLNRSAFQGHPFHLVSPSPWPLFTCISLLTLTLSGVLTMHGFSNAGFWLACAFVLVVSSMFFWFRDVVSEGTYLGNHTLAVQRGINMGVALFIVSEGLFFLAIFWAYFHSALSPTVELGAQWPPMGIEAINAFELPLLNTVLLLASGVTITYSHHSLIQGNRNGALYGAMFTIVLALIFTAFQGVEYSVSSFTLSDGAFGSCFYFGTFPRFTCYNWYNIYRCRILTFISLPLNWKSPLRFRSWNIILTFCWCCMIILILISLLLRFLVCS